MGPFWILYNDSWSPYSELSLTKYQTREAAFRAALDLKRVTGIDYVIMQSVAFTKPPPAVVDLTKEEYSDATSSEEPTTTRPEEIGKQEEKGEEQSSS